MLSQDTWAPPATPESLRKLFSDINLHGRRHANPQELPTPHQLQHVQHKPETGAAASLDMIETKVCMRACDQSVYVCCGIHVCASTSSVNPTNHLLKLDPFIDPQRTESELKIRCARGSDSILYQ